MYFAQKTDQRMDPGLEVAYYMYLRLMRKVDRLNEIVPEIDATTRKFSPKSRAYLEALECLIAVGNYRKIVTLLAGKDFLSEVNPSP